VEDEGDGHIDIFGKGERVNLEHSEQGRQSSGYTVAPWLDRQVEEQNPRQEPDKIQIKTKNWEPTNEYIIELTTLLNQFIGLTSFPYLARSSSIATRNTPSLVPNPSP
jgi:hypothetical protein